MTTYNAEHIKAIDELEIDINVAIVEYENTGDIRYIIEADNCSHKIAEIRRNHDSE